MPHHIIAVAQAAPRFALFVTRAEATPGLEIAHCVHPTRDCEGLFGDVEMAAEALQSAEWRSAAIGPATVWREMRMTAPPFLATYVFAPAMGALTATRNTRVDLIGTANKAMLTRREADIVIRIEDRPQEVKADPHKTDADRVGLLLYAVYAGAGAEPEVLPWAGLSEQHVYTTGSVVMPSLARRQGYRYQARPFSTRLKIAATGMAKAVLPRCLADVDARLACVSETALNQPLWMLSHKQDRDVTHLRATRALVAAIAAERLSDDA